MGTISDCWHIKGQLKEKSYLYVKSTTQRRPKKIMKLFWLKIFSICQWCRWHRWCTHLELRISLQILEKILNGPNGIIKGLREIDSWKKSEVEIFGTVSLMNILQVCDLLRLWWPPRDVNDIVKKILVY
jgi:hypothetical protein